MFILMYFFYWLFPGAASSVDPLYYLCFMSVMLSCLFLAALWSPAGKELTSWLSCIWCFLVFFVTFPYGVLGPVLYLIVSFPDLWPQGYDFFSCSTQLSTKFILLINVKMPTIVGILTYISMINTPSESPKQRNFFICQYFSVNEQLKFSAQLSSAWKKFYHLGARSAFGLATVCSFLEAFCELQPF